MKKRILYIPFDHLHPDFGVLRESDPDSDLIVLIESQRMLTGRPWHPERLFFLISSARHFVIELQDRGFHVEYLRAATTIEGLTQIRDRYPNLSVYCAQPSSHRQTQQLEKFGVHFYPNNFFLTPRESFHEWASTQKSFVMESFYRSQRIRLDILMDGKRPAGGEWNFDKENRLGPPKNHQWPPYSEFPRDEVDHQVATELGYTPTATWATTRSGARARLKEFLTIHFMEFGPYEDAMTTQNWALHHSLLSPYLNNGLLHPAEVIDAVREVVVKGSIPIASAEGFVRQIIGWREYVNGMYWYLGGEYREKNELKAHRKLLPLFSDSRSTSMNCVRQVVSEVEERAWVHHIPRLMVLSNLALIAQINPQEFLDWMREMFVDASDWVMVPNVIGMGVHADGGMMMTKPYAAGGAYISRMSDYCKGCSYNPKLRTGASACPFTTLYWNFLDENKERFSKNHRMFHQVNGLKRLDDLAELKVRALEVLQGLEKGQI